MIEHVLGKDSHTMLWWQMCLRALIVFAYLLVMIRLGGRRMFGRFAGFDIAVAVLIGSMMSRVLTGNAPIVPTFAATAVLIALHRALAWAAYASPRLRPPIEGNPVQVVRDGALLHDPMRHLAITEDELRAALRSASHSEDLGSIRAAYVERSGTISFVKG